MNKVNLFRDGSKFAVVFGHMMEKGTFTRQELELFAAEKGILNPSATISMLLSPRPVDESGTDTYLGNPAVPGHQYFVIRNEKAEKGWANSYTFTLAWRDPILAPRDGKKGVKASEKAARADEIAAEKLAKDTAKAERLAVRAAKKLADAAAKLAKTEARSVVKAEKAIAKNVLIEAKAKAKLVRVEMKAAKLAAIEAATAAKLAEKAAKVAADKVPAAETSISDADVDATIAGMTA